MHTGIVLASTSPRRQQLLAQVGCKFRVEPSDFYENNFLDVPPEELARVQARAKAMNVAQKLPPDEVVIGADTLVCLNGKVFGKPQDAADAKRMLAELSGRTHVVYTGVAVVRGEVVQDAVAATQVTFRPLTQREIAAYAATGEPLGKAGAYAIQGRGALLVERIDGCYANVVGLPLTVLAALLTQFGIRLL